MAIEMLVGKVLAVFIEEGVSPEGKPIYKRYGYSDIDEDATSDNLKVVARILASLSNGQYSHTRLVETKELH